MVESGRWKIPYLPAICKVLTLQGSCNVTRVMSVFTCFWWFVVVIENRMQEIAEIRLFRISMNSVLSENIMAIHVYAYMYKSNTYSGTYTLETQPVGCYTEVVCSYSGTWSPLGHNQLARGGLLIQWSLYIVVTLGTQPVGCYTEVACLYSGACI